VELEFVSQNWHLFLALVVIVGLIGFDAAKGRISGIRSVSAVELPRLINHDDAVIVDVCETAEFRKGHIPGAINLPLSQLKDGTVPIDKYRKKNNPIVVTCQSGNRSMKAASIIRKSEFQNVYNLTGGLTAWAKENFPIEK
jgi:rhodanese-related sulfurtransferase